MFEMAVFNMLFGYPAAIEGLCACYVTVTAPTIDAASTSGMTRNHSFNISSKSSAEKEAIRNKTGDVANTDHWSSFTNDRFAFDCRMHLCRS